MGPKGMRQGDGKGAGTWVGDNNSCRSLPVWGHSRVKVVAWGSSPLLARVMGWESC